MGFLCPVYVGVGFCSRFLGRGRGNAAVLRGIASFEAVKQRREVRKGDKAAWYTRMDFERRGYFFVNDSFYYLANIEVTCFVLHALCADMVRTSNCGLCLYLELSTKNGKAKKNRLGNLAILILVSDSVNR